MTHETHTGGCLCGDIRYAATGPASNLCFCHCTSCRRSAGSPAVPWATFALERFKLVKGKLTEYRSSPKVVRGFCARCGTSLTYYHEARVDEIDVTLGSMDNPAALPPTSHIWMQDEVPWVVVGDGLPQYPGWRPKQD